MRKVSIVTIFVICLALVFAITAYSENGKFDKQRRIEKENGISDQDVNNFEVHKDGKVTVDNIQFSSMTHYFLSEHFKGTHKRCKEVVPEKDANKDPHHFELTGSTADCTSSCTTIKSEYWPTGVYTIPVVFHVMYKSDGTGNIPDSRIINQVAVLNEDYRAIAGTLGANGYDTKIQFELAGITRTQNDRYFADRTERKYKQALGWDQTQYLNVYVNSASGYLGYAYFPQTSAGTWQDGVVLLYAACGGRDEGSAPYNQGRTLTHEIGHYLGLYHTFQGGCATGYCGGDLIEDTNPEAAPYYYCGSYSSCGNADPTTNYMDYSEDLCMWKFTAEQANRAVCGLVNYRPNLYY